MRRTRALGALLVLALGLLGAPVALALWGRLPTHWAVLGRPDDGALLLAALTVLGWLAWLAFAASTVAEVVGLVARRHVRIPLLGRLQQVSAGLLLAVLALAPRGVDPPEPQPSLLAAPQAPPAVPGPDAPAGPAVTGGYLIEPGDDLWTVSERTLGDGARWRDLVAANPDLLRDPTSQLTPGTRLALPAGALDRGTRPHRVTVERGDTLSGLALEHLGAAGRWPRIASANPGLIDDPDHIEVGWRLTVPEPVHRAEPRRHERQPEREADPPTDEPVDRVEPTAGAVPPAPGPEPTGTAAATTGATPSIGAPTPSSTVAGDSTAAAADGPDDDTPDDDTGQPGLPLLGTVGSLAAAAIIGTVEARRFLRLRERPVGRRFLPALEAAVRVRTALGATQRPDRLSVLDAALRRIGKHCFDHRLPLPELARITVSDVLITLEWARLADEPPPGFGGDQSRWTVDVDAAPDGTDHPCPYPAVVSLGSTGDGELVLVDVERSRVLGVASDDPELRRSSLAAMAVELACAPWAADARLVILGPDAGLVRAAGAERVQEAASVDELLDGARTLLEARRSALGSEPLAVLRRDPDRAEAVAPVVLCVLGDAAPDVAARLDELLAGPPAGVAAIVPASPAAGADWQVGGAVDAPRGRLRGTPGALFAHAIPEATRASVAELFRAADDPATTRAPWWGGPEAERDDNVVALPARVHPGGEDVDIVEVVSAVAHPQVLLLGPTELRGATGPEPARSRQQLIELCAWLLEHPGSTATAMAAGLAVAEGTRRSNLSRLRAWLGTAPDGSAYLPDAYSGRVLLHPGVTSDWHRLRVLLSPGIDRVGESTLVAALDLVRGAPLADAAPGQWHWAEELRTDLACALRDVGVVLADRALARGDLDLARWAASRALVAAAGDELLMCARIRTEHRAGNGAEVGRLVNQVTRQARLLGVDLLPGTVQLCQEVIEGQVRARA